MSVHETPGLPKTNPSPADKDAALFANLVLQQTNMALMFMGKVPHPESGKPVQDLEGATMFVDTLEMIEAKTKGNLSSEEDQMLKHSLMSVRMAFVEASSGDAPPPATEDRPSEEGQTAAATPASESSSESAKEAKTASNDDGGRGGRQKITAERVWHRRLEEI